MRGGAALYSFSMSDEDKEEPGRGVPEKLPGLTITAIDTRPHSRGKIELRSRNAADPPLVMTNWMTHPEDRKEVVAMVRGVRKLVRRRELSNFVAEEVFPGLPEDASDEALLAAAMANSSSGLHGTGTCRIGTPEDGVIDSRMRVAVSAWPISPPRC